MGLGSSLRALDSHVLFQNGQHLISPGIQACLDPHTLSPGSRGPCQVIVVDWNDFVHPKARDKLRQYLKDCFAILYVYDMFPRQTCGSTDADDVWVSTSNRLFASMGCRMQEQ